METKSALIAFALVVAFSVVHGQQEGVQKCITQLTEDIQPLISGGMSDMNEVKKKYCPALENFFRCGMKASFKDRPSDDQLDQLKQSMAASSQGFKQNVDCDIDINKVADDVWSNGAVNARPLPVIATVLVAFMALFFSLKKL